jgi:hypothetical protein
MGQGPQEGVELLLGNIGGARPRGRRRLARMHVQGTARGEVPPREAEQAELASVLEQGQDRQRGIRPRRSSWRRTSLAAACAPGSHPRSPGGARPSWLSSSRSMSSSSSGRVSGLSRRGSAAAGSPPASASAAKLRRFRRAGMRAMAMLITREGERST